MSATAFNGYTPAPQVRNFDELYGPDPYDYNFCYPIDFNRLETDRVALRPFIPRVHAPLYYEQVSKDASLEEWLPFRTESIPDFLTAVESWRRGPENVFIAIIDKGRPGQEPQVHDGSFAGVIGLFYTSFTTLSAEIGPVMAFPAFQRTYVMSSAIGLLLRYCLEVPSKGGLGLRRVQWTTSPFNTASIRTAIRMGFRQETILRWSHPLQDEKKVGHGRALREGDPLPHNPGRDSVLLAITCEEWEDGGRESVQALMDRK